MKADKLRVQDLQVGSWVMIDVNSCVDDEYDPRIGTQDYQPFKIESGEWLDHIDDTGSPVLPIPITKEILEKNGFEREELITLYNHYTGIDNKVSLNDDFYYMKSRNMWTVHIDSEDYRTIAHCELTYLHELQHLLRICKIDFEFNV